jgi:hypothetical protein
LWIRIWYRKLGGLDGGHLAARTKCKINKESVHRVAGGMEMEIIAKMIVKTMKMPSASSMSLDRSGCWRPSFSH